MPDPRRRLPSVDALLRAAPARRAAARFGREVVKEAIREVLADLRRTRATPPAEEILTRVVHRAAQASFGLTTVINATGVVLHTNLGRAPLPASAARAASEAAAGYVDLEVERDTGRRGRRADRAELLLRALTGAEAALVVNNNAAALMLALAALARRKEVLVSRGELIEIGGEFRLPDIMRASGAKLVEVGTTNRTRLSDYERAISGRTGLILAVHPSNYRVVGFTHAVAPAELAGLGVPVLHDIGSGLLRRIRGVPAEEPAATEAVRHAGLVCFSGDKLLGGPQAGILLGRAELVEKLRRHPIARAVRVDKMTMAALEAVLHLWATGRHAELPVWRALTVTQASVRRRAAALAEAVPGAATARGESVAGGGSLPGYGVPTTTARIPAPDAEGAAARLRGGSPSVFCRVEGDALLFDLRTVDPADDERLARAIRYALAQEG